MADSTNQDWGLSAIGRHGHITVELDESLSEPRRWQLTIESLAEPKFYLLFSITNPDVMQQLASFLAQRRVSGEWQQIEIGKFGESSVSMICNNDDQNRFTILISTNDGTIRQTWNENQIPMYRLAILDAIQEHAE